MGDLASYLFIVLGVLVAVIFPVMRAAVSRLFNPGREAAAGWLRKYALLFVFSLVTALIALAIYRAAKPDTVIPWYTAFLLGFAWESTIEKFQRPAA